MDPLSSSSPHASSPRFHAFAAHSQRDASPGGGSGDRERLVVQRHASEGGAAADENHRPVDNDDADERMSNDESMSSTSSSLDIEDVVHAIDEFHGSDHRTAFEQQQHREDLLRRPASFSAALWSQHALQEQQHDSSSFDYTFATSHANRKRSRRPMWLLTQFASAMSKSTRSNERYDSMEDQERNAVDDRHSSSHTQNRRLEWASEDSRYGNADGVQLVTARNEVTGLQVRLRSNRDFHVTTDYTNWFAPQGHTPRARVHVDLSFVPPQLQVEMFVIGYVEDENKDMTMEYLDRTGVSTVLANEQAVYIRFRVAHNVRSGVYELPVRVFTQHPGFSDETLSWCSSIHLRVANIVLPSPHEWKFHLDLWQHFSSIARTHCVALWSDAHFSLIGKYLHKLSEFGQKCITVVATEMPWIGQQCYAEVQYPSALYEHSLLEVYESPELPSGVASIGETATVLKIDFQHFDRLLALANQHHMDAEIEVFGLLSIWRDPVNGFDSPMERNNLSSSGANGQGETQETRKANAKNGSNSGAASSPVDSWRIRCFNRQTGTMRYLRCMAEVERFIELFYAHCVALGIVDRIRVCADEPSQLSLLYDQLQFLQRLAPRFKIKLALNNLDFMNFMPPQVVDYVPLLPIVCADLDVTKRVKAQIRDRGGKFCWYVCCGPAFPNQFVSSPLIEGELIGYLTFFLELDGFLRWNYCLWPAQPWTSLKWRAPTWKVGDMYFVLPGKDGAPVETLRLESLRFAIQVFELLRLAQEMLERSQMEQLKAEIAQLIWRTTEFSRFCRCDDKARSDLYSLDPLDYQRAKVLLIDTLANAKLAASSTGLHGTTIFDERIGSPPVSPREGASSDQ
uniref:Glycoside hydrolase 123 catalytic domain-containing protein n=1 Tax=Globisporangium ultimum (strain ATCC 200006 / CBS 805.95 / DAOM BR144) TaxID=431595 RepID=K3W9B7_GLOUD